MKVLFFLSQMSVTNGENINWAFISPTTGSKPCKRCFRNKIIKKNNKRLNDFEIAFVEWHLTTGSRSWDENIDEGVTFTLLHIDGAGFPESSGGFLAMRWFARAELRVQLPISAEHFAEDEEPATERDPGRRFRTGKNNVFVSVSFARQAKRPLSTGV